MSMRLKEREEGIQQVLGRLAEESDNGIPTIVEGRKDVEALRSLGIEGVVISAKSGGRSLLDVISEVEKGHPKEVILLLDCDRRGNEYTRRLRQHLETAKIVANTSIRRELFRLVGKEVRDVESLGAYLETLREKYMGHQRTLTSLKRAQAKQIRIYQRKLKEEEH